MMTLPVFTDPNPSISSLRTEQERLKRQTDKLIETTRIFDILKKYGELSEIGGSYKYGLMVYPDLDIGLTTSDANKQAFADLVKEMVASDYVRKVATADTVNFTPVQSFRPKGYWLGLEIPFENERWGVDCWLQQPSWTQGDPEDYSKPIATLDQSKRDLILMTKYHLIHTGSYGKTVFSGDVYDVIINNEVGSLVDVLEMLKF